MAKVFSVNISKKKGTVKKPVKTVTVSLNGIAGDAHSGKWHRQISLMSYEKIKEFDEDIKPGEFAENITSYGLNTDFIKVGQKFKIGNVILEVSQIGKECHDDCVIKKLKGACIMPKKGIFFKVIKGGKIKKNDTIQFFPEIAVLTISTSAYKGKRDDLSGKALKKMFSKIGMVKFYEILPDDEKKIMAGLKNFSKKVDLIVTTGGTGFSPFDFTAKATKKLIEREVKGIGEVLRLVPFLSGVKNSVLTESVAGFYKDTLIINFPGSLNAVKAGFKILKEPIVHLMEISKGLVLKCST